MKRISMAGKLAVVLFMLISVAWPAQAKNAMHIVINNHLGAPEMLIDENQHVVWQAEYDEFGKANILVEEVEFNQRLPGQYYDKETGLSYNYYRDYDPSLGRYVQSDPIGLKGGINTYAYSNGNPVMNIDPMGLDVTMTCRPVATATRNGLSFPVHCSVIVWHLKTDKCGNENKVIDDQYSVEREGTAPTKDKDSDTYTDDRNAFNNPGGNNTNYDIPMPPIYKSQSAFDNTVRQNGDNYSQGPYNPYLGPNSNTAATNIIQKSGGNAPNVHTAWGQHLGK